MHINTSITHFALGTIGGLASAILVDVDAWKSTPDMPFDWNKAFRRWTYGIVTGMLSSFAISSTAGGMV